MSQQLTILSQDHSSMLYCRSRQFDTVSEKEYSVNLTESQLQTLQTDTIYNFSASDRRIPCQMVFDGFISIHSLENATESLEKIRAYGRTGKLHRIYISLSRIKLLQSLALELCPREIVFFGDLDDETVTIVQNLFEKLTMPMKIMFHSTEAKSNELFTKLTAIWNNCTNKKLSVLRVCYFSSRAETIDFTLNS